LCPTKAVTQVAWKPFAAENTEKEVKLAVASEDSSLRIFSLESLVDSK